MMLAKMRGIVKMVWKLVVELMGMVSPRLEGKKEAWAWMMVELGCEILTCYGFDGLSFKDKANSILYGFSREGRGMSTREKRLVLSRFS